MRTDREIAEEVGRYLHVRSSRSARPDSISQDARSAAERELAREGARGLNQPAGGIGGWVWRKVEPLVKQQICTEENYARLNSIPTDQLAMHIDDILTPLVISVTDKLPALLKFLVPLLSSLRKQIASIIAQELQRAVTTGWSTYCGLPPQT
jgi:hypothetical protein